MTDQTQTDRRLAYRLASERAAVEVIADLTATADLVTLAERVGAINRRSGQDRRQAERRVADLQAHRENVQAGLDLARTTEGRSLAPCGATYPGLHQPHSCTLRATHLREGTWHVDERAGTRWTCWPSA